MVVSSGVKLILGLPNITVESGLTTSTRWVCVSAIHALQWTMTRQRLYCIVKGCVSYIQALTIVRYS